MQTPQGYNSTFDKGETLGGMHHSAIEGGASASASSDTQSIPSQIVSRTFDNVGAFVRGVPRQLKNSPLAVLGVGIGVGVAIGAMFYPLQRVFGRSKVSGLKAYRKQIIKALGL